MFSKNLGWISTMVVLASCGAPEVQDEEVSEQAVAAAFVAAEASFEVEFEGYEDSAEMLATAEDPSAVPERPAFCKALKPIAPLFRSNGFQRSTNLGTFFGAEVVAAFDALGDTRGFQLVFDHAHHQVTTATYQMLSTAELRASIVGGLAFGFDKHVGEWFGEYQRANFNFPIAGLPWLTGTAQVGSNETGIVHGAFALSIGFSANTITGPIDWATLPSLAVAGRGTRDQASLAHKALARLAEAIDSTNRRASQFGFEPLVHYRLFDTASSRACTIAELDAGTTKVCGIQVGTECTSHACSGKEEAAVFWISQGGINLIGSAGFAAFSIGYGALRDYGTYAIRRCE